MTLLLYSFVRTWKFCHSCLFCFFIASQNLCFTPLNLQKFLFPLIPFKVGQLCAKILSQVPLNLSLHQQQAAQPILHTPATCATLTQVLVHSNLQQESRSIIWVKVTRKGHPQCMLKKLNLTWYFSGVHCQEFRVWRIFSVVPFFLW